MITFSIEVKWLTFSSLAFLIPFLNTGGLSPFSSQWEAMEVTLQAPWTCACSGSSHGLKPDLLQQVVFDSPNHCLCLLWLGQRGWSTSWRLNQKSCQIPQPFNVLDNQVSSFLLQKIHIFPSLPFITMYIQKLFMIPLTSLARFNSLRYFGFPNLAPGCPANIQFLCTPPRLHVLASTLCRLPFGVWVFQ